eukprot:scaffold4562_cov36-Prasinocladus_malaysianus.AAC.1
MRRMSRAPEPASLAGRGGGILSHRLWVQPRPRYPGGRQIASTSGRPCALGSRMRTSTPLALGGAMGLLQAACSMFSSRHLHSPGVKTL